MKHFVLFCLIFLSSCVQHSVVRQPELMLHVTNANTPLENVSGYLYWISDPYSRLEQVQNFVTGKDGNLRLEEVLESDTTYLLMLHGVSYYEHKLCIEAPGYRSLLITMTVLHRVKSFAWTRL
jgi:hypothetical protein